MMRKILATFLISFGAFAQTQSTETLEEAILLNQELEFLEQSASALPQLQPKSAEIGESRLPVPENFQNLERTYFSDEEKDSVRVRTAAPKRQRGL